MRPLTALLALCGIASVAGSSGAGLVAELRELAGLRAQGHLTADEFNIAKSRLIGDDGASLATPSEDDLAQLVVIWVGQNLGRLALAVPT